VIGHHAGPLLSRDAAKIRDFKWRRGIQSLAGAERVSW
jgi:hypothetical protein